MPRIRRHNRGGIAGASRRARHSRLMARRRQEARQRLDGQDQPVQDMIVDQDQPPVDGQPPQVEAMVVDQAQAHADLVDYDDDMIAAARNFEEALRAISMEECTNCHCRFPELTNAAGLCGVCAKNPAKFARTNIEISPVPPELQGLSFIEQMLIARVHPVVQLYRIRGAQTGYKGNVISFVQDISEYIRVLPLLPAELAKVILFTKDTPTGQVEFQARRDKLLDALRWLKANNCYYRDIIISDANLDAIPADGDMVRVLRPYALDDSIAEPANNESNPPDDRAANTVQNEVHESFVPLLLPVGQQRQLQERLRLPYPATSANPVDEFSSEGYIAKAFPCLFPTGKGDFLHPRQIRLTQHEYMTFLMKYNDRRFIKDQRFCYFMMNTVLRHQALAYSGVAVRRNELEGLTAADLRRRMETDRSFLNKIMAYTSGLRSTKQYWFQRCGELLDMTDQLGSPTIFFTLSAADYHWPDLFRLLMNRDNADPDTLTEAERRKLMHENPDVVAFFLQKRCKLFLDHILVPIFGVADYWHRFEWQWRGSGHMHGLLWLKDAPNVDQVDFTPEQLEIIRNYFDHLSCAINPWLPVNREGPHPCRKRFSDVPPESRLSDLNQLLNYFQRHTVCGAHCLRMATNDPHRNDPARRRPMKCRFKFPIPVRERSAVEYKDGRLEFFPRRNDTLMGRFNAFVTHVWRANTDVSAITDKETVTFYIAKYASKEEKSSKDFLELMRAILARTADDSPAKRLISSLVIKTVGDRDYSAQEVMHILFGWPMYGKTREFVVLNFGDGAWQTINIDPNDDSIRQGRSMIEKYRDRPTEDLRGQIDWNNMTLLHFAKNHYTRRVNGEIRYSKRQKEAVVRVFPRLKLAGNTESDEKYYRLHVILNVPFRGQLPFDQLLHDPVANVTHTTWRSRHQALNLQGVQPPELPEVEDEGIPPELINEEDLRDPFMIAAGMANERELNRAEAQDVLGQRPMDTAFDWEGHSAGYPTLEEVKEFLRNGIPALERQQIIAEPPTIAFSDEQLGLLEHLQSQIDYLQQRPPPTDGIPPKLTVVQGKAGCGKSTMIREMIRRISVAFGPDSVAIVAPTGIAALNIDGYTLHSLFHIPTDARKFGPLTGEAQQRFQLAMANIRFVIVDEMSMVGLMMLHFLETRCKESRQESHGPTKDEPFGGLMVWMFGDFRQLPPVGDQAMYDERPSTSQNPQIAHMKISGRLKFNEFTKFIELRQCQRQSGPEAARFRTLLDNLSTGSVTAEDHALLMTRRMQVLDAAEIESFRLAIHIYPTNRQALRKNDDVLRSTNLPVARIVSFNRPDYRLPSNRPLEEDIHEGLVHILNLQIGCRVMLRTNINVPRGLVNSSMGTVRAIVYAPGESPPALPQYVLVEFDGYDGPFFPSDSRLFPVVPITRSFKQGTVTHHRTQLPLMVGYATTVHKSQGLTLDKVVIDIGDKDNSMGQTYVGLSRCKRLEHLMLESGFPKDRLDKIAQMTGFAERNLFIRAKFGSSI